jgi:hypothetical protein
MTNSNMSFFAPARPNDSARAILRRLNARVLPSVLTALLVCGCATSNSESATSAAPSAARPEGLLIVDCRLPAQVRKLGTMMQYLGPRRTIKASAHDCELSGGEYVAYDRATPSSALKAWLPDAETGDSAAQNYVGEIFERGFGVAPDYAAAATWYKRAAEQGLTRAQINLGSLYERGLGVEKDIGTALQWYRKASGIKEPLVIPEKQPTDTRPGAPKIDIIDPPVIQTRGFPQIKIRAGLTVIPLVGKIESSSGILSLRVNDHVEQPDPKGVFRTDIAVLGVNTVVRVVAVDKAGRRGELQFTFVPDAQAPAEPPAVLAKAVAGKSYAIIIGDGAYEQLPKLDTAIPDAKAMAALLKRRYGFEVTTLFDANRYDILSTLNDVRSKLGREDSLLIYYAGHGELDRVNFRGYWLPIDAEAASPANWISNVSITDMLNAMDARHVIVIADSCYSGAMGRSPFLERSDGDAKNLERIAGGRSRTVFSSGGLRPVLDNGGGQHSVFAKAVLDALESNREVLDGRRLHQQVAVKVATAASKLNVEQIPEYSALRFAGHEAGDFVFVPRNNAQSDSGTKSSTKTTASEALKSGAAAAR